jgi:Rps23 Pro-64 3,4-dihydroxylase Tpa1-like proline 4-hydroxylase
MDFHRQLREFFRADSLTKLGEGYAERYQTAEPFAHIAIDGLFPDALLDSLVEVIESPDEHWQSFENSRELKSGMSDDELMPPAVQAFIYKLNSPAFLGFLETMTGIENLIPDPHLTGGGLHCSRPGGFLEVHTDFNYHRRFKLERRLNLIIYLNKDWREEYGGHLELWTPDLTECKARLLPQFNRNVVFSTSDSSFHGHPEPLTCPEDRARRSIAMYYYTNTPPESSDSVHTTVFRATGDEAAPASEGGVKRALKLFVPPIISNLWRGRPSSGDG